MALLHLQKVRNLFRCWLMGFSWIARAIAHVKWLHATFYSTSVYFHAENIQNMKLNILQVKLFATKYVSLFYVIWTLVKQNLCCGEMGLSLVFSGYLRYLWDVPIGWHQCSEH